MLGAGEQLRQLTITVQQLLERGAKDLREWDEVLHKGLGPHTMAALAVFQKDGDVVCPCSSIVVTVRRRKCGNSDSSASRGLGPHCVSRRLVSTRSSLISICPQSTTESRGELEKATNQGHSALSRYRIHRKKWHLERSIAKFERALSICPLDHPCRAAAQTNLAMAKFILCQVEDTDASLAVPLGLYSNALATRPVGHVDRPSTLIQLAAVHFARFEKRRDGMEGARAEALLHEAMELSSAESHERRAATFVLQLRTRRRAGPVKADDQLRVKNDSASRLMNKDPWIIIGAYLVDRFERFGDVADLQPAIRLLEELVGSTPVWDRRCRTALANLGTALYCRFNHFGELRDLEDAISMQRDVVELIPDGHPNKPASLNDLGNSLITRFERLGELGDLEDAISRHRNAAALTPHGHPGEPARLNGLGICFFLRFARIGDLSDLEDAISTLRDAVELNPHGNAGPLYNLGNSLRARFERLGKLRDLDDAISRHRDAVDLTPDGHPLKHTITSSLGISLIIRFECIGELGDLEDGILRHRDAVNHTRHGHPDKPACLNNLGNSLITRFGRFGELGDLEDAISRYRDAVALTPHGHPLKPRHIGSLGISLATRFRRLGRLADLDDAISRYRDAVSLTPHGHPDKPSLLNNLGHAFSTRFEHLGQLGDLEDAISTLSHAVDLTPCDHPDKLPRLTNLGNSFVARFWRLGELGDLDDAISRHRDAVHLTPHGHPHKPIYLNNLSIAFKIRFHRIGELSDLEHAISTLREAVDLTPHGHPDRDNRLNNLGDSLAARFARLGEVSDLEGAISRQREAVALTPHSHPRKPRHLNSLGISLAIRFNRLAERNDLEDAISILRDAVELTPHGHSDKPARLVNLGNSFVIRFEHLGDLSNLEQAISLYSHAASARVGPIRDRFHASQQWISCTRRIRHRSLLHAYYVAINLLPELAWIGLSLTHRYAELARGADLVREAAAAALDSGLLETAVEWLEQGRSIVWGELFQLRSSYDELSSAHPDHAYRLRELSTALEHASTSREKSLSAPLERSRESLKQEADRHRTLAIERDQLLQEIRRFPGFERFLLHKQFSQLRASAHSGAMVILNDAESRCDALIVLADVDHVIHVPLPNLTFQRSTRLQNTLEKLLGHARVIRCDDREGRSAIRGGVSWESLLSTLWNDVVKPVLDVLSFSVRDIMSLEFIVDPFIGLGTQIPGDLSRIFWCPTGPFVFLPIHAAGFYDAQHSSPGHKVSDFVISSYAPTLSILAPSPNPDVAPSGDLRLLAVRQPPSDGLSRLPGVATELEHIRTVIRNSPSTRTTLLESSKGTVEEVLSLMKEADWVHFACHGIQDAERATQSGLCLADGRRLKISDIIALSRPRGGLAFLSACQTALGDEGLSDEAIHIAAGMLFAGYGGVIGTMWSISDKLAPGVARDVYEQLFRNGTRPDYREAARALHGAVGRLRDSGKASFVTWLPFIHVGL